MGTIWQEIMHEIVSFEKRYGRKPRLIVFCSKAFADEFFAEVCAYATKTPGIDFKDLNHFYGVPFEWQNVWTYGGSAKWVLVGG